MSERGKIVRIRLQSKGYTDFVKFEHRLETDEMRILDECLKTANETSEPATPPEQIVISGLKTFEQKTGKTYMLCPAPYLYDVILV